MSGSRCLAPIFRVRTRWCPPVLKSSVPHEQFHRHAREYRVVRRRGLHSPWSSLPRRDSGHQRRLCTIRDRTLRCILHPDRSEVHLQQQLQARTVQPR